MKKFTEILQKLYSNVMKNNLFKVGVLVVILVMQTMSLPVFALTPKEEKGVKTLKSPRVAYESPTWFTPFTLDKAPEDLGYRLDLLPEDADRTRDMYVVLPTLGLITPVIMVPEGTADHSNMMNGREIDINKYLNDGVMHYPGTGMPGDEGNPVIFGHSNFFKHGEGRYKTIFADIMNLDVSYRDEIWVYTKLSMGTEIDENVPLDEQFAFRKFRIEESYETVPTDVGILNPKGGKELTVFACTNGLEGRWILRGKLIEDNEILMPYELKFRYLDALEKMKELPEARQQEIRDIFLAEVESVRVRVLGRSYDDKFKKYILNYLSRGIE